MQPSVDRNQFRPHPPCSAPGPQRATAPGALFGPEFGSGAVTLEGENAAYPSAPRGGFFWPPAENAPGINRAAHAVP